MTDRPQLFEPGSHEPLIERPWDPDRVRAAIAAIALDAEAAFHERSLWAAHPVDLSDGPLSEVASIYLGAAGVILALDVLARAGSVSPGRDWARIALDLPARYRQRPDFPTDVGGPVPSLWMGEAGILLVAHSLAPTASDSERLLDVVRANTGNPSLELMWGSPGTMIAARVMHERTGDARWRDAWNDSAATLLAAWEGELWAQLLYGKVAHYIGPAHGFAGNVLALTQGDLLDSARRQEIEERAIATLAALAHHDGGLCQWPPALEPSSGSQPTRTQWCHGAPGIVTPFATVAPRNDQLSELLSAGGELTWRAGPLAKGANLCHGTAGNGFAFLKLFRRTGDELWLERARRFAMHAAAQVERARAEHGRGRHSLWTGDPGTALFLQACLHGTAEMPSIDVF